MGKEGFSRAHTSQRPCRRSGSTDTRVETQEALKTQCSQGLSGTGMASKKPGDVTMCRDGGFLPQKGKKREGGTSEKAIRNLSKNIMCSTWGPRMK